MYLRFLLRLAICALPALGLARIGLPGRGDSLTPEARGLRNLTERPYGTPIFKGDVLERIWKIWDADWKARVDPNDPAQIRRLVFERYGFTEAPYNSDGVPMQFVATEKGWVPTCMQCHAGRVPGSGEPMIGQPNTDLDVATLAEDLALLYGMKTDQSRLGMTRGRSNAFVFAIELIRKRNEDLSNRKEPLDMGTYKNTDLDAIPWWHLKKKKLLYSDGAISGDFTRPIMQFTLAGTSGEEIRSWEADFTDILAYLRSIEPPRYPWEVDAGVAREGKRVFESNCSRCHGTYGEGGTYPNLVVPIEEIGTDAERLVGVTKEFRRYYNKTWFGEHARADEDPVGYIAPPLDGVWASAPYFHNGSVPTVYAVLSPEARPKYFRRVGAPKEYDTRDLGFKIEVLDGPPSADLPAEARRRVIDTTLPGLGNQGHPFGSALTENQRRAVIEYLKTL